ncbi:hypothetical protein [Comamonas sp.]|uniref:hypothetical protein n=1 Tax=Comamonas sp. TaxID=34028 RepID=UPI002585318A|nr:hypothetical protein [Comamonas sp.]
MRKFTPIFLLIITAISGCTNLTSPARHKPLDANQAYWFDYDATRRGTLIVPAGQAVKTCSEPSPDVALTLVSKLDVTAKKNELGEVKGNAEFNASVVKLAERTQMVMFLRESLYRLCEHSLNNQFTKEEILSAYKGSIDAAVKIIDTDTKKAEALRELSKQNISPTELQRLISNY